MNVKNLIPVFALFLLAISSGVARASVAVLSDMQIKTGKRGMALSMAADAPFTATFTTSGRQLTVALPEIVYGLHEYAFSHFPSTSPIEKITARETSGTSAVTITFKFKSTLPALVKSVRKNNQWLVLLSDQAEKDYVWNAAGHSERKAEVPVSQTDPQRISKVAAIIETPSFRTAEPAYKSESAARLTNIRSLQRGAVEHLTIDFNQYVTMGVKRDGSTLRVLVKNAGSLPVKDFILPAHSAFQKIAVQALQRGWLSIAITIKPNKNSATVVQVLPRQLVLFAPIDTAVSRLAYWSAANPEGGLYNFVTVAPVAVDYDQMGRKVKQDATVDIAQKSTFEINEKPVVPRVTQPEKKVEPSVVAKPEVTPPPPPRVAALPEKKSIPEAAQIVEKTKRNLWTIKKDINLRAEPSTDGEILRSLPLGTKVVELNRKPGWVYVDLNSGKGWVSAPLVAESSAVAVTVWQALKRTNAPVPSDLNTEALPDPGAAAVVLAAPPKRRPIVEYKVYNRDPFVPLVREDDDSELFNVQDATLVGILYDKEDKIALIEDRKNERKSYALREHDQVKNGTVLRIERDQIIFLLTEMGISRTYSLKLNGKQDKPR